MMPYQKRRDFFWATLCVLMFFLMLPFITGYLLIQAVAQELRDLYEDFPGQVRWAFDDVLRSLRQRRRDRAAERQDINQPEPL
ncbi:hypothetical protein RSP795_10310 [Ralstonia solanacearum]|uniref:hypothetical protein n=1 Tax=Ralstonia solanacearum TaxID=305 RepID=UPI0007D7C737|nr:hypothetical protein [Ralstonia solanacearum]OAI62820.1 hypothetical protein RSP795_10310 [Ralstonia solanacearum]